MRAALESRVRQWWAGEGGALGRTVTALTWPLEMIYRGATALRAQAFERGWLRIHHLPVPVVSVGNLVVGGTGKTPVSGWLIAQLKQWGRRPALVASGYGSDEILLHLRWNPDVPVHSHPDRVLAGREAADGGADVLVLDDGFQHRRLARDVDLVLVAAEHTLPGRLLPRGPYREGPDALARASAVLVTWRTAEEGRARELADELRTTLNPTPVGVLRLAPCGWTDLTGRPADPPDGPLFAVASIADPEGFRDLVHQVTGATPRLLVYPDHHDFTDRDVGEVRRARGSDSMVLTEKDAVKLAHWRDSLTGTRVLRLEVEPGPGASLVLQSVRNALQEAGSSLPRSPKPPRKPRSNP